MAISVFLIWKENEYEQCKSDSAAGTSSRFAPLSYEMPKALTEVKGEILIERQIRQLHEAGIKEIYIIVGYKAEQFEYLREKLEASSF